MDALDATVVRVIGIMRAEAVTQAVGHLRYLHAGPPISLAEIGGPARGALLGALMFEGSAKDVGEAQRLLDAGAVTLTSTHEAGGVGALSGVVTPSMPCVVVEADNGRRAFAPINEGLGRALRFGSHDSQTLERLRWLRDVAAPIIDEAISRVGGVNITELQAEGLRRGDECHNRNVASTAALMATLAPPMVRMSRNREDVAATLEFMGDNPHFFLSFSIASAKAIADTAHSTNDPGVVTAMAFNGKSFGIRVSGLGDQWFTSSSIVGDVRLFEGHSIDDAATAVGDSSICEVVGLGAFALSASPALTLFTGGDPVQSPARVAQLRRICRGESSRFLIPYERFRGTPIGIDVGLVAETRIPAMMNMGVAHKEPGGGQIGAGLAELPLAPFLAAHAELAGMDESDAD